MHDASCLVIHLLKNSRIEVFRFDYSSGVKKTPREYPLRGYKYCVASSRTRTSKGALFFLSSLFLPSCPTSPSFFLSSSSSFLLFLTLEPRRKRRFRKQKRSHSRVLERKDTRRRRNRSEKERERKRETKGGRVPVKEDSVSLFAGGLIRAQGHFYTEPSLILSHPHGDCPSFGLFSFFFSYLPPRLLLARFS